MAKKGKSLKRPGSPTLSESSGNESTRKKQKKVTAAALGSRPGTPGLSQTTVRRPKITAGSGSDGEATAGEMSDGAMQKKKIKLVGSSRGTPSASRAGSPNPAAAGKLLSQHLSNLACFSPKLTFSDRCFFSLVRWAY
jgi:transcription initiation factor TFIIF subunit alpha